MTCLRAGRLVAAAAGAATLVLLAWPLTPVVAVDTVDGVAGHLPAGDGLTLRFVHSVDRLPIEDGYRVRADRLVQHSTRLVQFGAGTGHVYGEGVGRPDGRWWSVEGMDRDIGDLALRVGPRSVDHRLRDDGGELALSHCWAGQRVTLRPTRLPLAARPLLPLLRPECTDG